jgi:predicted O-methyltransferase YrrM
VNVIAQRHLAKDQRVSFLTMDAEEFLKQDYTRQFDLIFADTFPGKFYMTEEALTMLKVGGIYVIDDLLPQPTWPDDHGPKVDALVVNLERRSDLILTKMKWASGLIIATKIST